MDSVYQAQITQLNDMYKSFYTEKNQTCKYYNECSRDFAGCTGGYNSTKSTLLGENYNMFADKGIRIMVVGEEDIHDEPCNEIKHPSFLGEANNPHYVHTMQTLLMLFGMKNRITDDSPKSYIQYNKIFTSYCLTNYFKCAFKNIVQSSNVQHNATMAKNCGEILKKEIEILDPTIIIIQGKLCTEKFWNDKTIFNNPCELPIDKQSAKGKDEINLSLYHYDKSGKKTTDFYVIWSYHPCAQGKYCWENTAPFLQDAIETLRKKCYIGENMLNYEDCKKIKDIK